MEDERRHLWEHLQDRLHRIEQLLLTLDRKVDQMAVSQEQFDTDLAALVAAITTLTAAVDAWIAAHPDVDLTAEDQQVQAAAAAVAAELAKVTPVPADVPAPDAAPADVAPADAPVDAPAPDAAPADAAPVDVPAPDTAPADVPAADAPPTDPTAPAA